MTAEQKEIKLDSANMLEILGVNDVNLKQIEERFSASITVRGDTVYVNGVKEEIDVIEKILKEMIYVLNTNGKLESSDVNTIISLTKEGKKQAKKIGARLKGEMTIPDAVITSPSPRTKDTFEWMKKGWPELAGVEEVCHDERIREQGHGLISVYSDLKVMFAIHREQRQLCDAEGQYFYKFPGGEDMPDVNLRVGLFLRDVDERFAGKRVMIISHFRTILSLRAMLEHLSPEDFNEITTHDGPINCGVTRYERESVQNEDGKLVLARYNEKLYD